MTEISNKMLSLFVAAAIFTSLAGFYNSQLDSQMTGYGTTGKIYVNISSVVSVNVTKLVVDFGNSTMLDGVSFCTLQTENVNKVPVGCWGGVYTNALGGLTFMNAGNKQLNVTVSGTKINGSDFFGVPGAGSKLLFRCPDVSSTGNGTARNTDYVNLNTTSQPCIDYMSIAAATRGETMHVNVTIPSAAAGSKSDTVTFLAIRACAATC